MLKKLATFLIGRAERRVGVSFDYSRQIAETDIGLLMRYNRIFGLLDPNRHTPAVAYHAARLTGALAADCGACVEAEINLARNAGVSESEIANVLRAQFETLSEPVAAVVRLAQAVTRDQADDPDAREQLREAYGEAGLIELSLAMNGAAFLPGVKRAMGYATACDLKTMALIK